MHFRIDESFVIKVADFGLSEDVYCTDYFRQGRQGEDGEAPVKLPLRWMAVESLNDGVFSEKTDVVNSSLTVNVKFNIALLNIYYFHARSLVVVWCDVLGDILTG